MKKEHKDYLTTQIKKIKTEGEEFQFKDENFKILLYYPITSESELRYTIMSTEKFDPSKHTFDYMKELLFFEETFIEEPIEYDWECDPNENPMYQTIINSRYDLTPHITAGCKYIPFIFVDNLKNKISFSPDGKLLVYFFFYGGSNHKYLILLENLYNKIKNLNIEFKLVNSVFATDLTENEMKEKFSFMNDFPNYETDGYDEETVQLIRLYNFYESPFDIRVSIVNSFEKFIFNGVINCEENIDYIISKINENANKENFEVTEEDEFMGKIGSRYEPFSYGKESLEKIKNKPVPECFEERMVCHFSYSDDDTLELKYLIEF